MHTMFGQAPISGFTITCMKTILEHGSFYVIPFMLFLQRKAKYKHLKHTLLFKVDSLVNSPNTYNTAPSGNRRWLHYRHLP